MPPHSITSSLAPRAEDPAARLAELLAEADRLAEVEPSAAQTIARSALGLAGQLGNDLAAAQALRSLGLAQKAAGAIAEAGQTFAQGLTAALQVGAVGIELSCRNGLANCTKDMGELDASLEQYLQLLERAQATGSARAVWVALTNIGLVHDDLGEHGRAVEYHKAAYREARRAGESFAQGLLNAAVAAGNGGSDRAAYRYCRAALALYRRSGDRLNETLALTNLALAQSRRDDAAGARASLDEALAIARAHGFGRQETAALVIAGEIEHEQGRPAEALPHLQRALQLAEAQGNHTLARKAAEMLAQVSRAAGVQEQEVTARDTAEALRAELECARRELRTEANLLRIELKKTQHEYRRMREQANGLLRAKRQLERANTELRASLRQDDRRPPTIPGGPPLSPREREVLALMAAGRTNAQIGATLGTTETTARNHVSSILTKLNLRTRTEAVALALRNRWV